MESYGTMVFIMVAIMVVGLSIGSLSSFMFIDYCHRLQVLVLVWPFKVTVTNLERNKWRFSNFFFDLRSHIGITHNIDRKKRLRYPHTPNEAAMDCKRRREEPCII